MLTKLSLAVTASLLLSAQATAEETKQPPTAPPRRSTRSCARPKPRRSPSPQAWQAARPSRSPSTSSTRRPAPKCADVTSALPRSRWRRQPTTRAACSWSPVFASSRTARLLDGELDHAVPRRIARAGGIAMTVHIPPVLVLIVCKVAIAGAPDQNADFTGAQNLEWATENSMMTCRRNEVQLFDPVEGNSSVRPTIRRRRSILTSLKGRNARGQASSLRPVGTRRTATRPGACGGSAARLPSSICRPAR